MVWRVIPLEQVLVWDSFTLKNGQLQTGEGRFYAAAVLLMMGANYTQNMKS
jgi:hypothetical protein